MVRLTITEAIAAVARLKPHSVAIPIWKMRRVLDSMEAAGALEIHRVANYRTISGDDVHKVAEELIRIGWLVSVPAESEAAAC